MFLALCFLGLTASALQCPAYQCQGLAAQVCGVYLATTNEYLLQECAAGEFCPVPSPSSNSTCKAQEGSVGFAWVGEVCNSTVVCVGQGECYEGRCTSPELSDECEANYDCGISQFCDPVRSVCVDLIPIGGACYSDFQCLQNSGCNMTLPEASGLCVRYLSLPPGSPIASCDTGYNLLCTSGICHQSATGAYCMSLVAGEGLLPEKCVSDAQCRSQVDPVTGGVVTQLCTCGFTAAGDAYCPAFPGESTGLAYLSQLQAWVNSDAIFNCSSQRRFNDYCMYSNWDTGNRLKYLSAYLMYSMYPLLQGNSDCVKDTFTRDYWLAQTAYENYLNQTHPDFSLWIIPPFLLLLQPLF